MKSYDYDIALIMKKVLCNDGAIQFIPVDVVEGYYAEDDKSFIDFAGTPYYHIISNPNSFGFCKRIEFNNIKKKYPLLNNNLIKTILLREYKKYKYFYFDDEDTKESSLGAPVIIYSKINSKGFENAEVYRDDVDVCDFYSLYHYEFFKAVYPDLVDKNLNKSLEVKGLEEKLNIKLDVKDLYNELTSRIIDQDEPIRKILTAIWKQTKNFSESKSRNILINGGTGVGKTEIFRVLSRLLEIPCVITSATQYSGTGYIGGNVEDMLVSLVKRADGDLEKAERGILVIDEVDKLAETNASTSQVNQKDVQEALLKILEDGILPIKVDDQVVEFDTSKLMVIAMGSWSRVEVNNDKSLGFGADFKNNTKTYKELTRDDMVKNGMISDFIGRFNTIIQMNDLSYESFVKILKTKYSILSMNKDFLSTEGIKLTVNETAYNAIAKKAENSKFGAREIDSIVETALSQASFEIASNPDKYKELIISEETIEDNKKYVLVNK